VRRARKQHVRKGVADSRDAQLVPRVFLAEQVNGFEDLPALLFRVVDPGERGHELTVASVDENRDKSVIRFLCDCAASGVDRVNATRH
jgi:hypothetical protein